MFWALGTQSRWKHFKQDPTSHHQTCKQSSAAWIPCASQRLQSQLRAAWRHSQHKDYLAVILAAHSAFCELPWRLESQCLVRGAGRMLPACKDGDTGDTVARGCFSPPFLHTWKDISGEYGFPVCHHPWAQGWGPAVSPHCPVSCPVWFQAAFCFATVHPHVQDNIPPTFPFPLCYCQQAAPFPPRDKISPKLTELTRTKGLYCPLIEPLSAKYLAKWEPSIQSQFTAESLFFYFKSIWKLKIPFGSCPLCRGSQPCRLAKKPHAAGLGGSCTGTFFCLQQTQAAGSNPAAHRLPVLVWSSCCDWDTMGHGSCWCCPQHWDIHQVMPTYTKSWGPAGACRVYPR